MDKVSVENFRSSMGDYLDRVYYCKETIIVTRNGTPFVLLAPVPKGANPSENINARNIRTQMSQVLGKVHFQETDLLIMRRGRPTAILTSAAAKARAQL
jgi:antitoxin (DNA-binding transcriptional repressor) of toxin-antitoxin stability system